MAKKSKINEDAPNEEASNKEASNKEASTLIKLVNVYKNDIDKTTIEHDLDIVLPILIDDELHAGFVCNTGRIKKLIDYILRKEKKVNANEVLNRVFINAIEKDVKFKDDYNDEKISLQFDIIKKSQSTDEFIKLLYFSTPLIDRTLLEVKNEIKSLQQKEKDYLDNKKKEKFKGLSKEVLDSIKQEVLQDLASEKKQDAVIDIDELKKQILQEITKDFELVKK